MAVEDRRRIIEGGEEEESQGPDDFLERNVNPAQLKKDFYAGTLDLLDPENYRQIRSYLVRDKVKDAEKLVDAARRKQMEARELKKRVEDSRYKLYPRVFKGVSPLRSLNAKSVPKSRAGDRGAFDTVRV